jgi:hypothetical protein
MRRYLIFVFILVCINLLLTNASFIYPADKGSGVDKELQKKIDSAIERGTGFLLTSPLTPGAQELILLTFIHGGVSPDNDIFKVLLNRMLESPLSATYNIALQAMALEKLDSKKYQERIAECAQWLVDAQCKNGQWSYGSSQRQAPQTTPGYKPSITPSTTKKEDYIIGAGIKTDIIIKRKIIAGVPSGDNSNTQYGVLGLRACMDAGIALPKDTIMLVKKWWENNQNLDGSWSYGVAGKGGYASMTAGGMSSLAILKYYLKEDYKKCSRISKAVRWMESNFPTALDLRANWALYTYYSFERAGILAEQDKFGRYNWYLEGAKRLLGAQNLSGSWSGPSGDVVNTCFAILFLKRATKSLQAEITPVKKPNPVETPSEPEISKPDKAIENPPVPDPKEPVIAEKPPEEPISPPAIQARIYIIVTLKDSSVMTGSYLNYHNGNFMLLTDYGIEQIELKNLLSIEYRSE